MLNFKKAGIFSRGSGQEDACEQEDQSGGVLAVWGSPGSGKTTVAVRLAKYLADKRRNVILLLCDMTAPMLPCICPAADLECERSLGSVLAAAHVSENLVKNNLVTHKRLGYLTMLGMLKGENEYTYPPYNEVQARELIDCLREIAPYALWNSCGCNSISKGCDTGWNGMGTSNTRHTAVAGLDPSGRNRSYPSSRARKGESCDGGKRPADKRQRPPNPG